MSLIRAKTGQRILFAATVVVLAVLSYLVFRAETQSEWIAYQREFKDVYRSKILERLDDPEVADDPLAKGKWEKQLRELNAARPGIQRIYLPGAHVRDLCTTCHLGIDNPLFADAPEPLTSHPGRMLDYHPPQQFGCTL